MAIVSVSHSSFFMTNLMVPAMHVVCLVSADISVSHLMIDPVILMIQSAIDFMTAGMIFSKTAILGHGNIC